VCEREVYVLLPALVCLEDVVVVEIAFAPLEADLGLLLFLEDMSEVR
jgi:hypothetical protein